MLSKIPEFIVHKEILSNGLTVLVYEMPWAQSASARLLINTGPRDETDPDIYGCAHYLEHMLLEGSKTYPTRRELERAIKSKGGKFEAYTDKEYTMYQAKLPFEYATHSTRLLKELVFNPLMSKDAVAREKGIISAELKKSIDDPIKNKWNLLRQVWEKHSLGHNNLGTFDSIQKITRENLISYHNRYYSPDNAILVISGNVTRKQAIDMAAKDFGNLEKSSFVKEKSSPPAFDKSKKILIEQNNLKEANILFAFSTEGIGKNSAQLPELQILSSVLSRNIFYKFVYGLGFSYSAGGNLWLVSDTGFMVIYADISPQKVPKSIDVIIEIINSLKITNKSITEAKESLKSGLTLNLADPADYAHFIGEQQLYKGKVKSPEQIKADIDSVTISAVERLRKKLITKSGIVLALLGSIPKNKTQFFEQKLDRISS